MRNCPLIRNKN